MEDRQEEISQLEIKLKGYEKEIINIPFYQPVINLIWKINLNFLI